MRQRALAQLQSAGKRRAGQSTKQLAVCWRSLVSWPLSPSLPPLPPNCLPVCPPNCLPVCSAHGDLSPEEQALLKAVFCLRNKGQVRKLAAIAGCSSATRAEL